MASLRDPGSSAHPKTSFAQLPHRVPTIRETTIFVPERVVETARQNAHGIREVAY